MSPLDPVQLFKLDPNRGSYISSFGPKGSGKSELNTRFFISYPYNALLMDVTGDVDPDHKFSRPFTPALHRLAKQIFDIKRLELSSLDELKMQVRYEWRQGLEPGHYAKYRLQPNIGNDDWLRESDAYVGLAYLAGRCFIFLDEIGDEAPANQTPRWTRLALRWGRHEQLSMGMCGPRPADLDPNVLNQADIVTVHGQLHELDIRRMARQLHLRDDELIGLIAELTVEERDGVEVHSFLAYVKRSRELFILPPLPARVQKVG